MDVYARRVLSRLNAFPTSSGGGDVANLNGSANGFLGFSKLIAHPWCVNLFAGWAGNRHIAA